MKDVESDSHEMDLHVAEYSALMARATNYVSLKAGIWPLMAIYLALVAQICKPDNMALDAAFANLLRQPIQRALMIWGNLLVLEIMLKAFSQFMIEQYEIVLYIEKELRKKLANQFPNKIFWGYEKFHGRQGTTIFANYWDYAVGLSFCVLILFLARVVYPLSRYDIAGLAFVTAMLLMFVQDARVIKNLRKEWRRVIRI